MRRKNKKIYKERYGFEDGSIGKRKEELDDPKKNTLYIKELAKELGADIIGVSKVKKG